MWPFQITTYIIWRSYCLSATRLLSLVVRQYLSIPSTLVDLTVLRGFLLPNVCGVLSTIVCLFYYCIVCLFYYYIICLFCIIERYSTVLYITHNWTIPYLQMVSRLPFLLVFPSIYDLWLPIRYLQAFVTVKGENNISDSHITVVHQMRMSGISK